MCDDLTEADAARFSPARGHSIDAGSPHSAQAR
jgi:hypothetical protein